MPKSPNRTRVGTCQIKFVRLIGVLTAFLFGFPSPGFATPPLHLPNCPYSPSGFAPYHPSVELVGEALCDLQSGEPATAYEKLIEAEIEGAPFPVFIAYHTGRALIQLERFAEARATLLPVVSSHRHTLAPAAATLRALAAHGAQWWSVSLEEHTELIEIYPDHPHIQDLQYRQAIAWVNEGDPERGVEAFSSLIRTSPDTLAGQLARQELIRLATMGIFPRQIPLAEHLEHGRFLRTERRWSDARAWLETTIDLAIEREDGSVLFRAEKELADLAFASEQYEEALQAYRLLNIQQPSDELERQIARSLQRLGKTTSALQRHQNRMEQGANRSGALNDLKSLFWWEGLYTLSRTAPSPAGSQAKQKVWEAAWLLYRTGNLDSAVRSFEQFGRAYPADRRKASYWKARAHLDGGDRMKGLQVLEEIVRESEFDYYGLQSLNRLYEAGRIPDAFRVFPPASWPTPDSERARIHWWPVLSGLPHPLAVPEYSVIRDRILARDDVPSVIQTRLGEAFFAIESGHPRLGRDLLRILTGQRLALEKGKSASALLKEGPKLTFDNRPAARRSGQWGSSSEYEHEVNPAEQEQGLAFLEALSRIPTDLETSFIELLSTQQEWQFMSQRGIGPRLRSKRPSSETMDSYAMHYPPAYERELFDAAVRTNVRSDLVRSLIHVESRFNPLAISRSDARGLMQVLPRTGRLIARELGYREFAKDLLLEPSVALRFGTWYLSELTRKFNGQEVLAVCSYNTGPFNVSYWLSRKPDLPFDVFLEEVPWRQPRAYVKKVLSNLQVYTWLRTGSAALYVSNGLDSNFQDNINF